MCGDNWSIESEKVTWIVEHVETLPATVFYEQIENY